MSAASSEGSQEKAQNFNGVSPGTIESTQRGRGREQAKQETREALILAALSEFSERGLSAPSLDAICARAGYTRGAFYVHFADRDELIAAVMEKVTGVLLDALIATGDAAMDLE